MPTATFRISGPRRSAWMTARARNAARRGWLVAAIGTLAVVATLLVLVLVPREVNRTVRARLAALPAPADTAPLLANLTGALDRLRNAEANLQGLRVAYADRVATATSNASNADASSAVVSASGQIAEQSDARSDLLLRVARARSAPLVENFRAVGEADFLRNDAPVRVLLDSLNDVNRDREAYAALGGPDARYAALTARLSTLGQRMLLLAEQRLASSQERSNRTASVVNATAATDSVGSGLVPPDAVRPGLVRPNPVRPELDTALLAQVAPYSADSSVYFAVRAGLDTAKVKLQTAEQLLLAARETNASIARERERVQRTAPAQVPPVAMLVAALVIGVAVGYGVAFYREIKHPRVADAAEAERVTESRVIVHSTPTRAGRRMRHRRQSDDAVASVIDTASDSYQLLHVTLTGFGDTSRYVEVLSQDATLGATVGINLAAAAARDSRSTLLIDSAGAKSMVRRMFARAKRKRSDGNASLGEGADSLRARVTQQPVGRDLFVDTVWLEPAGPLPGELLEIAREHDFSVVVRGEGSGAPIDTTAGLSDVILCARAGATSVSWIAGEVAALRQKNRRLRAVLLWSGRAPARA